MSNNQRILVSYTEWCNRISRYLHSLIINNNIKGKFWLVGNMDLVNYLFDQFSDEIKKEKFIKSEIHDFIQNFPLNNIDDTIILVESDEEACRNCLNLINYHCPLVNLITRLNFLDDMLSTKQIITNDIDDSNITFIIQGIINRSSSSKLGIEDSINSIRYWFPDSNIIISTWKGQNVNGIEVDKIIKNDDPGPLPPLKNYDSKLNNCNRQIVSTFAGLKATETEYCVKLRSDAIITGKGFLNEFIRINLKSSTSSLFNKKIVISQFYTLSSSGIERIPFHISDIFQFGLRKDLLNLWKIPLMNIETATWFQSRKHDYDGNISGKQFNSKYAVEQYIIINFLKNKGIDIDINVCINSTEVMNLYNNFIANEYIILNHFNLEMIIPKFEPSWYGKFQQSNCISEDEWKNLCEDSTNNRTI